MRHNLALLLCAAVLASPVGCIAVGGGWADNWSVPAPMAEPDRYTSVDVAFDLTMLTAAFPPILPTFGLHHCFDGDESFTAPYIAYDLGTAAWSGRWFGIRSECWWPILRPVIGRYHWSESPEETGLLTGLKVGAGTFIFATGYTFVLITLEYGWLNAHGTVGDSDARFRTLRLALTWTPNFVPQ